MAAQREDFALVEQLLDRAAALPVGDDLARNIVAQKWLAASTWPAAPALRSFFWARESIGGTDPMVSLGRIGQALAAEPDSGMAHYLLGRNLRGRGASIETTRLLSRALELGLPHPLLVRECARILAEEAYRAGDFETVERAAAVLTEEGQPDVIRLTGDDWLERVAWKRTRAPR
jgi:hypothetical protein